MIPVEDRDIFLQNGNNTPWPREEKQTSEILGALGPVLNYLWRIKQRYNLPGLADTRPKPYLIKDPNRNYYEIIHNNTVFAVSEQRINIAYNLHDPISPSLSRFAQDMYELCLRHNTSDLEEQEWVLRKPLFNVLNRVCGPLIEYYGSPLTVNNLSMGYFTDHYQDAIFSANFKRFTKIWALPGIIGPNITSEELKQAIIWCMMSLKLSPNNYFILILKNSLGKQQKLASQLDILENVYIKHWCTINERTSKGYMDTELFLITESKYFANVICEEITNTIRSRIIIIIGFYGIN